MDVVRSVRHLLFGDFRRAGAYHLGVVAAEVLDFFGRFREVYVLLAFELRHRGAVGPGDAFVRQHEGTFRILREDEVRDQIDDLPQQGSGHHVATRWSLQLHYGVLDFRFALILCNARINMPVFPDHDIVHLYLLIHPR